MATNLENYTYIQLREDILRHTDNSDTEFVASIDRFIRQAESKIGGLVKLPAYLKNVSFTIPAATTTMLVTATPISITDFISVSDFTYNKYGIIQQKSTGFIAEAYPDSTETGPPRYFAMQDDKTFLLGPTTDAAYAANLHYNAKWPSLVDLGHNSATANQTTFIANTFETALLSGCLYFAFKYMQNHDAATDNRNEMMEALGVITTFGTGAANKPDSERTNAANDSKGQ